MEKTPLYPGTFYHIFNHAVGFDDLFKNDGNFYYFLEKYEKHIPPIAHTFAYCLMPNHLHLVVRIREVDELLELFATKTKKPSTGEPILSKEQSLESMDFTDERRFMEALVPPLNWEKLLYYISKQFGNLFSAYAQAFNKQQGRKGNLFISNFERIEIDSLQYLKNSILYNHFNPVHHGFVSTPTEWPYSSFNALLDSEPSNFLCKRETLMLFDGEEGFINAHRERPNWKEPPAFFL
ncbi:MAG: hypothetical protein IT258_17685 [Saprospiraceae bacterium]|nr:hypothetical protein [Saprospiraceae bacterium]